MRRMTLAEARLKFLSLAEMVKEEPLEIAKRGRPVMVAMGYDHYRSLLETIDILADQSFYGNLRKSVQQAQEGKTKPSGEVRSRLGI